MMRAALFFAAALLAVRTQKSPPSTPSTSSSSACHAPKQVSPPKSKLLQFVPTKLDVSKLNRRPQVSYTIDEDGSVRDIKIVKGTGSTKADAGLVKSIQAWKFEPQAGCTLDDTMTLVIDIW